MTHLEPPDRRWAKDGALADLVEAAKAVPPEAGDDVVFEYNGVRLHGTVLEAEPNVARVVLACSTAYLTVERKGAAPVDKLAAANAKLKEQADMIRDARKGTPQ